MVLGFAAVMVLPFFITDFALNLSNKPAVTKPPQVETGSGGQGSDAPQEPQSEGPVAQQQKAIAALWLPERTLRNASALVLASLLLQS